MNSSTKAPLPYRVSESPVHGRGVFARRRIPAGARVIEYRGERIDWDTAERRHGEANGPLGHTFFFTLEDGRVIDGGSRGNDARFINHSCAPNCEAIEEGGRIWIHALRDIVRGEELSYDYGLVYDGRRTAAVRRAFACRCGAPDCTGTMLAPKTRRAASGNAKPGSR